MATASSTPPADAPTPAGSVPSALALPAYQQLLRYEAMFDALAEMRVQDSAEGIAALAARRWKFVAPVDAWRLTIAHDDRYWLIDSQGREGRIALSPLAGLAASDAALWCDGRTRRLAPAEYPGLLPQGEAADLLVLPVQRLQATRALLFLASGQAPFTPLDCKFIRLFAEQLVDRLYLAFGHAAELQRLKAQALTDVLTGAANRAAILDHIQALWDQSRRSGQSLSVLMVDVDHFKLVNDHHGHDAGDQLLRLLVGRFQSQLRSGERFGRIGGEEFLFALTHCDTPRALAVAERLRRVIADSPFEVAGCAVTRIAATVSIGVASCRPAAAGPGVELLLKAADKALYESKSSGRNRVSWRSVGHPPPGPPP